MLEKWTGVSLMPRMQFPAHCFSWLQTMAQTADMGLFSKSICPASISRFSLNNWITMGIGV